MISSALRTDIETWASGRDQNPMFKAARSGRLTQAMVTRYIANVTYMIRLTPGHLRSARDGARRLGDETLAAHYEHKIEDEIGHDVWGEADLESLTKLVAVPTTSATPSIEALGKYLTKTIEEDPALYLAYLAFTEYITVLLGPELLAIIEAKSGVPRTSMTVIDNHIELDREHAEEAWGCIDDLVGDPRKIRRMRQSLAEMIAHFDGFCTELTNNTEVENESEPVLRAHVSAA